MGKEFSDMAIAAERIESLKAGTLAALALLLAFGVATTGNQLLLAQHFEAIAPLQFAPSVPNQLLSGAIAGSSGFLFGVTYRYIVRRDRNPHLKSGAVLAFGLVRGLALVDVGLRSQDSLWPYAVLGVESLLMFAIARFALDAAIQGGWVKPFESM